MRIAVCLCFFVIVVSLRETKEGKEVSKPRTYIKTITLLLSLSFLATNGYAQSVSDSTFHPLKPTINNSSFNLLTNIGIQRSFYVDIGLSWERFVGSGHGYTDLLPFIACSIFPSFDKNMRAVYGIKSGIQFGGALQMLGIESGYYWNGIKTDFLIIPKYCIGVGTANICYAYGFSTNNGDISRIGGHTLNLQINFPFFKKNKMKDEQKYYWIFRKRK